MAKKLYVYVKNGNGDYQFVSSACSLAIIKEHGVKTEQYYEFDISKLVPVDINIIVQNK